MKKNVFFEGKKIVNLSHMILPMNYGNRKKNYKVYIFEDNTFIKVQDTKGKKFKYICSECGCECFSGTQPEYGRNEYICRKCLSLNHNGMSGKHHTEEYKKLKSEMMKGRYDGENNPMYGKNWKDFTTNEVIENHKIKLSLRFSGKNNPMYGKHIKDYMTDEKYKLWKQHIKENGYHSKSKEEQQRISQKISEKQCLFKKTNPEYYKEIKSRGGRASMSKSQNYKKSCPEIIVENWLINHNIDYEYSPIMGSKNTGIFQYDFIIKNKRILIEVNGDYWHGNPNLFNENGTDGKRKLNEIQINKQKKDILKQDFAKNHNFELIYIWETEVNNGDFSKLKKIIC